MLAERQERIEHFQKEAFYKIALTDGKLTVVSENIANEEAADLLAALCNGSTAVVTQMKKERKKSFPPKLYALVPFIPISQSACALHTAAIQRFLYSSSLFIVWKPF